MCFTGGGVEDIPRETSEWSVSMHGADTPFRHWTIMKRYVAALFDRGGYGEKLVQYSTHVERAVKEEASGEWVLTLRREEEEEKEDYWWEERFDAVVVASGHFNVPYIPAIEGLEGLEQDRPGSVLHSKMYRGREAFRGKVIFFLFSFPYNILPTSIFTNHKSDLTNIFHHSASWLSAPPSRAQT